MCCPIFGRYAGYECTNSQQIAIPNAVATLHIPPMPLSPNSDFNFFFGRYFQIGKCIIALSLICATRFLINSFHRRNLLYFIVSFYRRFLEKNKRADCSFNGIHRTRVRTFRSVLLFFVLQCQALCVS